MLLKLLKYHIKQKVRCIWSKSNIYDFCLYSIIQLVICTQFSFMIVWNIYKVLLTSVSGTLFKLSKLSNISLKMLKYSISNALYYINIYKRVII